MCVLNIIPNTVTLSLPQDDERSLCLQYAESCSQLPWLHLVTVWGLPSALSESTCPYMVREELCRHIVTSLTAESLLVLIILAQRLSTFVISWHTQANY